MKLKELKNLIAQREGLRVDFKRDLYPQSIPDISKDIAAFANTEGGHIIVGVDDRGKVIGVDWDAEKTNKVTQEGLNCVPQLRVNIHEVTYPKIGTVVAIEIPKSTWIHSDPNKRFPLRLGDRTVFMDSSMILTLAKGKGMISGEEGTPRLPTERRKSDESELESYIDALSNLDIHVRAEALKQLSSMAFTTVIESNAKLLPHLVALVKDPDVKVRLAALNLFERLSWQIMPSFKTRYNKKLLPVVEAVALNDGDMEVKKKALEAIVASRDSIAVHVLVKLLTGLTEEQYKGMIDDNIWTSIVNVGLGPTLRLELFREYIKSDSTIRNRISRETANRYLG